MKIFTSLVLFYLAISTTNGKTVNMDREPENFKPSIEKSTIAFTDFNIFKALVNLFNNVLGLVSNRSTEGQKNSLTTESTIKQKKNKIKRKKSKKNLNQKIVFPVPESYELSCADGEENLEINHYPCCRHHSGTIESWLGTFEQYDYKCIHPRTGEKVENPLANCAEKDYVMKWDK